MKTAPDLALHAIHAFEHNAGVSIDDRWQPVLEQCIKEARAHKDVGPDDRLPYLWQTIPHPLLEDEDTTPGEVLQLFGLIVNAKRGILWDEG